MTTLAILLGMLGFILFLGWMLSLSVKRVAAAEEKEHQVEIELFAERQASDARNRMASQVAARVEPCDTAKRLRDGSF